MPDIVLLEALQKFLQDNVTSKIKLLKANEMDVHEYELVNPQVHIGWIPPKGFLPEGMEAAIPCIITGFDEGSDDGVGAGLNIRLSFAVFNPGQHDPPDAGGIRNITPDFQGYRDLLNLMEKARQELIRSRVINGVTTVQYPIKWGMYQDQPYPYWYGWITFDASCAALDYVPTIEEQYE
jgi:hypothetical protein